MCRCTWRSKPAGGRGRSCRAPERRAFALVVLASLDARGEGATRLALSAVDARLERLGAAADDRAAVARMLPRLLDDRRCHRWLRRSSGGPATTGR